MVDAPVLFFTKCGLQSIILIYVLLVLRNGGWNMLPGDFPMILLMKENCTQAFQAVFFVNMQLMLSVIM